MVLINATSRPVYARPALPAAAPRRGPSRPIPSGRGELWAGAVRRERENVQSPSSASASETVWYGLSC